MTFGDWLYEKRTALKMSQEELASLAGCSTNYISTLERNAPHTKTGALPQPSRGKVIGIANALGVPIGEAMLAAGYSQAVTSSNKFAERMDMILGRASPENRPHLEEAIETVARTLVATAG